MNLTLSNPYWFTKIMERLAVNYVWTYLYITQAPDGHLSTVWFDNIVIATDYIGPIVPVKKSRGGKEPKK